MFGKLPTVLCGERPKDWSQWLSLVEWSYNTNFHASTKITPYEALYSQLPQKLLPYEAGTTQVIAIETTLRTRDHTLRLLKENLARAQNRMKHYLDLKRTKRQFDIGD